MRLRPPFDPKREFVTTRELKVFGAKLAPGEPFDKSRVALRTLRQLYDQGALKFDLAVVASKTPPQVPIPTPAAAVPQPGLVGTVTVPATAPQVPPKSGRVRLVVDPTKKKNK